MMKTLFQLMIWLMFPMTSFAATYDESTFGDLSNDRLNPTQFTLSFGTTGPNGIAGNNVVSGSVGRVGSTIDRDYLHVIVPTGYTWSELRVGNQTQVGNNSSFIGLAPGSTMPVDPTALNATSLLGFKLYNLNDRGQDILDDMAMSQNGSSGFSTPLSAGSYTLWIQELAPGNFNYRFNLILTPVPEPESYAMLLAGFGILLIFSRRKIVR
jgi:PEP-CTERM motif